MNVKKKEALNVKIKKIEVTESLCEKKQNNILFYQGRFFFFYSQQSTLIQQ